MHGNYIFVAKKSTIAVFFLIIASAVFFTGVYYVNTEKRATAVFSNRGVTGEYEDYLISTMYADIKRAVEKYYGGSRNIVHENILNVSSDSDRPDCMEITVRVTTTGDDFNSTYGLETITFLKDTNKVEMKDYKHMEKAFIERRK
jgi:hypothetical protein